MRCRTNVSMPQLAPLFGISRQRLAGSLSDTDRC
ncbi:hypothetical protein [Streptomyces klenkii]